MREAARAKLSRAIKSLEAIEHQVARSARDEIPGSEFDTIAEQITRESEALEGLIPPFARAGFRSPLPPKFNLYDKRRIMHWLEAVLAGLRAASEDAATPTAPRDLLRELDFAFVVDPGRKGVVERDRLEIEKGLVQENWKSVIILAGAIMEALLIDVLTRAIAKLPPPSTGNHPNVADLKLFQLIDKAHQLNLVTATVKKLSHQLRDYRNIVHVNVELDGTGRRADFGEAHLSISILTIVHRELAATST